MWEAVLVLMFFVSFVALVLCRAGLWLLLGWAWCLICLSIGVWQRSDICMVLACVNCGLFLCLSVEWLVSWKRGCAGGSGSGEVV